MMLQGNAGLKPKEGEVTSQPWQWPINYRVRVTVTKTDSTILLLLVHTNKHFNYIYSFRVSRFAMWTKGSQMRIEIIFKLSCPWYINFIICLIFIFFLTIHYNFGSVFTGKKFFYVQTHNIAPIGPVLLRQLAPRVPAGQPGGVVGEPGLSGDLPDRLRGQRCEE